MATLLQKLRFSPAQCEILDFIKQHSDSIQFNHGVIKEQHRWHISGKTNSVRISIGNEVLCAELSKFTSGQKSIGYSFIRWQSNDQTGRASMVSEDTNTKFARCVYRTMYRNYIMRHGVSKKR